MGTRADFYTGGTDPTTMQWQGSIAWDGYPEGIPAEILHATSEADYTGGLAFFFAQRDDHTSPASGWPWPWNDSTTTDYAYTWTNEGVKASQFGHAWFDPKDETTSRGGVDNPAKQPFPDMTDVQNVSFGKNSGLIVFEL